MKAAYSALSARLWLLFCIALVVIPLAVIMAALGEFDAEIWAWAWLFWAPAAHGSPPCMNFRCGAFSFGR